MLIMFPTYGRDYESAEEVRVDWLAGKDFRLQGGQYINKQDAEQFGVPGNKLQVCFNRRNKYLIIQVLAYEECIFADCI